MRTTKLNKRVKKNHESIFYCPICNKVKEKAEKKEYELLNWPKWGLINKNCTDCKN